ncbi:MAG: macro domain-containing protein [Alphaproteobacteria bacterium CG_4_9_14_3_um_filter_47_13]|nr:MAG: macro domain-containing protein [Alphaproteobacteria bacterium CG_4_9_14_3_um_filter_47_13]
MNNFVAEPSLRSNDKLVNRITVVKGDITKQDDVDAIVSSLTVTMDPGGSLNRSIFKAAGKAFDEFILDNIYKPRPGDCYAVPGFNLSVANVLFVITPDWQDGIDREDVYLLRCYRQALKTAHNMGLRKIAFPALGTGHHGYPVERAARLALRGIRERMSRDLEEVRVVCDGEKVFQAFLGRLKKCE